MNAPISHTPTAEQSAILDFARGSKENLIIHALAGAAKTSTLVLIAKKLASTGILCLAFNVRIKDEMKARLPGNCESLTLNGIGHRTWAKALGRQPIVDSDKVYNIVKGLVEALPKGEIQLAAYEQMSDIIRAVRSGKTSGWVPDGHFDFAKGLINDDEFFASLDEEPTDLMIDLVTEASVISARMALDGKIDYDDQLLMPTCFFGNFPSYPVTMTDESQDLSELNHVMLKKIVRNNRLFAVGDENQSIYAFRGAHSQSMDLLRQSFSMHRMDLTISFRCPQAVVKEARTRAPAMQWPEWAKPGEVQTLHKWATTHIEHDAVILCRNNAPIFAMAVRLLKAGRYPQIVGSDIGKALVKIMQKLGPEATPREQAYELVNEWVAAKEVKSRDLHKVHDQAECMKVFIEQGATLGEAVAYAQHLMAVSGPLKMMTGHKSKGLEFPNVYILDRKLCNMERGQDRNLLYVMQTRAPQHLRGRVVGVMGSLAYAAGPLGLVLAGPLADAAVAGEEEVVDDLVDVGVVGGEGGVDRRARAGGHDPRAEAVDGGDGGGVELGQCVEHLDRTLVRRYRC